MSLNDILGSAASGLAAAQAGLRSVSNNIANVGTAGYARERTSLSTGVTGGRINGVVVGEPTRIADRFLETNVYARSGDFGRSDVTSGYLDRLQALLGAPGAEGGLPARLDAITASAVAMTGSQETQATATAFTANVQDTIESMHQLDGDVAGLRADAGSELTDTVGKVNGLLARIHDLNGTISSLQGLGRGTSGAEDQRVAALGELSALVAVTVRDQPDGRVAIDTASGVPLLDRRLRLLSLSSGGTGAQAGNSAIDIRFADAKGNPGTATGDSVESPAIGGKLGGLLDLRDNLLPAFADKLGTLFNGLAQTLNAASNASTTVPAPASLSGRATGLVATDRLGFAGAATFAVTKSDGTLVAKTRIDFGALGANATVADAVAAINTGLAGSGTASFANGSLSIIAANAGQGVIVAQDSANPSVRGGVGFSHYFGLNDMVESGTATLTPSGLTGADPSGFIAGGQADLVVRDGSGRKLASYALSPGAGASFGDLVGTLNASPLASYGSFAIDDGGRLKFQPKPAMGGATLSAASDSTDRFGTGRSFSALMGVNGASSGLGAAQVKPAVLADPGLLPLAQLQRGAAIGAKAIGPGDTSGATRFADQLGTPVDMGSAGTFSIDRFASSTLGSVGLEASQAQGRLSDATARRDDAVARRDGFSGVNIDEELSQMVLLQNSYSAAARVMSTASAMYDTLLAMLPRRRYDDAGRDHSLQNSMAEAIQRAQQRLAVTQTQLSTTKKAQNFADLGTEAVRTLSAHSMLARQDAESSVAKRVGTTLSLYDAQLSGIETSSTDLRNQILAAVGTGHADGLQEAIGAAFDQFRTALNAKDGGTPLFGGSQTAGPAFAPSKVSDLTAQDPATAFANDGVHASARVGEGVDMTYGISASDVGSDLYSAFQTLAQAGTIGETPSADQLAQLSKAVGQLDQGLTTVRTANSGNGRRQAQLDAVTARGDQRSLLLKNVIADNEDADLGQVAIDLAQRKATLEASYTVFSQLAGLSLANFLK